MAKSQKALPGQSIDGGAKVNTAKNNKAKDSKVKSNKAKAGKGKKARFQEARVDLSTALRWAAHLGLNEGVCNHFSFEVAPDLYLINPQGRHWSEVMPEDILLIDSTGKVIEGKHTLEPTAFFIHSWIHKLNPHAKCILHTHMPYTTALSLVDGGRLEWCNQNSLRFYGRIAYEDHYNGVALDDAEGERIARQLAGKDVMLMASHGVTVVGKTIAWAFDDLYYLERACMHQALAQQLAGKKRLRTIPGALCKKVAGQIESERQQSDLSFAAIKRLLAK